jgi:glycosyltransferase involved in cell wall biosynthesis
VEDQEFEGIKVKVLNIPISNKQPFTKRVLTFLKFAVLSSWFALRLPADVVVASSGPLTVGIPGLVARYLSRRRFVFEVRDLWPDVSIEIGALRNPLLKWGARQLEKRCYRAASLIVTLSPGMAAHIRDRHGIDRIISVPNAADNDFWQVRDLQWEPPAWARDRKIALYTGNIGSVNNSALLFDAAVELQRRGREDISVVLIGDGQERDALVQKAEDMSLSTFRVLGLMPKTELRHWVQRCLCALVPLSPNPILDTSSPNKLFDALAAGTPVVQTTNGWIKTFVAENECGFTVSASDPGQLADVLISLAESEEMQRRMGENAKRVAQTQFDRDQLSNRMLGGLEQVFNGPE